MPTTLNIKNIGLLPFFIFFRANKNRYGKWKTKSKGGEKENKRKEPFFSKGFFKPFRKSVYGKRFAERKVVRR